MFLNEMIIITTHYRCLYRSFTSFKRRLCYYKFMWFYVIGIVFCALYLIHDWRMILHLDSSFQPYLR
jgi:hypothetical protein